MRITWQQRALNGLAVGGLVLPLIGAACGSSSSDNTVEQPPAADASADALDASSTSDVFHDSPGNDAGAEAHAADSGDGGTDAAEAASDGSVGPVWFVHISDTHIATGAGALDVPAVLSQAVPVIKPLATLHTGDLVDDGGEASYWTAYHDIMVAQGTKFPSYLEIPGNHDVKNDGIPSYESYSVSGLADAGLYGITNVDSTSGRVRLVRTDTAESSINPVGVLGYFSQDQEDALIADPEGVSPAWTTLVLGHHPIDGLLAIKVGADRMKVVVDHFAAPLYLCGHVHTSLLSWHNSTLVVQAATLGANGSAASFMLVASDPAGPVAKEVNIDASATPVLSWPQVMITSPANTALAGTNPWAAPLAAGSTVRVRVLAFAPAGASKVEQRVDAAAWTTLTATGTGLFEGNLAVPAATGSHTLDARATSAEGQATDSTSFTVQ
jgi:hypothetical protein